MAQETPAESAYWSSLLAFVVALCAIACFIPPLQERVGSVESPLMATALGLTIAVASVLHLVFLAQALSRLGRSPLLWIIVTAVLFPVASVVALILLWMQGQQQGWTTGSAQRRV